MSGGGGSNTTVEKADPWSGLQPYLKQLYGMSSDYATGEPSTFYPGDAVAGFAPYQELGFDVAADYARMLPGMLSPAYGAQNYLLSGQNPLLTRMGGAVDPAVSSMVGMMNPQANPYLEDMTGQAMGQAEDYFLRSMRGVRDETQALGQNIGDTAYLRGLTTAEDNLSQMLQDISTSMYGGAYRSDMDRALAAAGGTLGQYGSTLSDTQMNMARALGLSPSTFAMGMMPADIYSNIGATQQAQSQQEIDALMSEFFYNQEAPYQQLENYANLLGSLGMPGGDVVSTTDAGYNRALGALGGGMAGYGMASMMSMPYAWPFALGGAALGMWG